MKREELARHLDELLTVPRFRDYCPNGLQVEGRDEVRRIVAGVTACQALLDAAVACEADAVLVHHGYFWKGEDGRITGIRRRRLATLLGHEINLFAYHLPLDAHPELGNNAQLAQDFGWTAEGRFGDQEIAWFGRADGACAGEWQRRLTVGLGREALLVGDPQRPLRRIGWCSGGAQSYLEQAVALNLDAFVSGEISEQTVHLARESGVAYLACGHHATEKGGVQALAAHLQAQGLDCRFIDIDNPV
jgi:dinuclear metal center YbgI/SA1388 family protein